MNKKQIVRLSDEEHAVCQAAARARRTRVDWALKVAHCVGHTLRPLRTG